MSFVKSLNLEEKLPRRADIPIPFVPKVKLQHAVNWVFSNIADQFGVVIYHSVEAAASFDPGYFASG